MSDFRKNAARIDLESLKQAADELRLDDDPEVMLRRVNWIGGRVTSLRSYAKLLRSENGMHRDGTD